MNGPRIEEKKMCQSRPVLRKFHFIPDVPISFACIGRWPFSPCMLYEEAEMYAWSRELRYICISSALNKIFCYNYVFLYALG